MNVTFEGRGDPSLGLGNRWGRCCQEGCESIARDQKLKTNVKQKREWKMQFGEAKARIDRLID